MKALAGSVKIGIRRARFASAILILPVDLYALKSRDLHRLLARWCARPGVAAAARIGARGRRADHFAGEDFSGRHAFARR